MKSILIILIAASFLLGCSTVSYVGNSKEAKTDYTLINNLGEKYYSQITLLDQKIILCEYLKVENDSLYYGDFESRLTSISLSKINKVKIKDGNTIYGRGCLLGFGAGLAAYLAAALATNGRVQSPNRLPVVVGLLAMPLGFVAGLFIKNDTVFVFNDN